MPRWRRTRWRRVPATRRRLLATVRFVWPCCIRVGEDRCEGGFGKKARPTESCAGGPLCKSSSDRVSRDGRPVLSLCIYAQCVGCAPDTLKKKAGRRCRLPPRRNTTAAHTPSGCCRCTRKANKKLIILHPLMSAHFEGEILYNYSNALFSWEERR
jgi:hypothetical protein